MEAIETQLTKYLADNLGLTGLQSPRIDNDFTKCDLSYSIHSSLPKDKQELEAFTTKIQQSIAASLEQHPHPFIKAIELSRGFLNITLNRPAIFQCAAQMVTSAGDNYGKSDKMKGKRAIVEHTSTNPNSTIHIGNCRSTITGAFIANMLRAVGYEVEEWFFVNDLGGQIGLTFVGFQKAYPIVKPTMKIDLWVGQIYAVCNTLNDLQLAGWKIAEAAAIMNANEDEAKMVAPIADAEKKKKMADIVSTFKELRARVPALVDTLVEQFNDIPIQQTAAEWNLRYEAADPEAVRQYRQMVNLVLSGQQETLDILGIHHQRFCYESELGWEGSNQRVISVLKETPFYVDRTQCNEKGKPEGGYLDLENFLSHSNLPHGKKGYQKPYPRVYIIRPDGSTLYTFRDIVFSIKKTANADLVLNTICSEQDLAQEKVQLSLRLLYPSAAEKLYHVSYDLVRLLNCRMSGRRGLYVTVDDVYQQLKAATRELIQQRAGSRPTDGGEGGEGDAPDASSSSTVLTQPTIGALNMSEEELENITHTVASAAIKYTLLSRAPHTVIVFDFKKATNPNEASAPFLLYNYARFCSLLDKFEKAAADPSMPGVTPLCPLEQVDWSLLSSTPEWRLLLRYVLALPSLVESIALPRVPPRPQLPQYNIHLLPEFLINFVRDFSSFYRATRIIVPDDIPSTHARVWFVRILRQFLGNGLRLMMITPLERM